MKALIASLALALALLGTGCGDDSTTVADRDDPHFATITYPGGGKRPKPKIVPPDLPPPKKLLVKDLKVGTGAVAHRGDEVSVYYVGVGYGNGKEIYFRWPPISPPWTMELGAGGSGKAFEEAIEGMRVGGRREVVIPSELAFGRGTLDYVVDLVGIKGEAGVRSAETEGAAATPPAEKPVRPVPVSDRDDPRFGTVSGEGAELRIEPSDRPPPKRLLVRDLELGSGPAVRPGDTVTVFYIGVDYDTGKRTIETWPPEEALVTEIRRDGIVAWEESVLGMRAGGRREVLIPAPRALGTGPLDYVFDLVAVEPEQPRSPGG